MDKITKFLKRLSEKEQKSVEQTLAKIHDSKLQGLDVKKLKVGTGLFRVRIGSIRIILIKEKELITIITIEQRGDNTYNL